MHVFSPSVFTKCFLCTAFMWITRFLSACNSFSHILHLKIIDKNRMVFPEFINNYPSKIYLMDFSFWEDQSNLEA